MTEKSQLIADRHCIVLKHESHLLLLNRNKSLTSKSLTFWESSPTCILFALSMKNMVKSKQKCNLNLNTPFTE